jgi:hypothetical protein
MGSNPISLSIYIYNGYRLTVDRSSSKRCVSIRIRLAVYIYKYFYYIIYNRVSNLIGKELPCQGSRCRIVADLTRSKNIFLWEMLLLV